MTTDNDPHGYFNFREMIAQQVFDAAARHLILQNKKSTSDSGGTCAYRGPDGCKCGAGIFLTDTEASAHEGETWPGVFMPGFGQEHQRLISKLQFVHDFRSAEQWPAELRMLAALFDGISSTIIEQTIAERDAKIGDKLV